MFYPILGLLIEKSAEVSSHSVFVNSINSIEKQSFSFLDRI
jgi:hypothetical protein